MQHVFHKSGYNYVKRRDQTEMTRMFTGPGIISAQGKFPISPPQVVESNLWSIGEVHQRHRKIMNPAFSAPQLRTFLTLFQDVGVKVCWSLDLRSCHPLTIEE